jgi:glyoxylase-like metal-dependent hydrolase (beta-lactamase superfamily II)
VRLIDVRHLGRERVIGCWQVGDVLIDPGPESSLETLLSELEDRPRALLLTHIHLDHAGATGAIVRHWPQIEVYVHERGARHLVDPSKLLASAARLYGNDMDRLWGEVVAVPEQNVHPLAGGERVLGFQVEYTPGHASHHVCYLHPESGRAFVGDVGGVRIPPADLVGIPTPPPDIDLEAWRASLEVVAEWRPRSLGITHFGVIDEPDAHLETVRERLGRAETLAATSDAAGFVTAIERDFGAAADPETAAAYLQAMPPEQQWLGLERYLSREPESGG